MGRVRISGKGANKVQRKDHRKNVPTNKMEDYGHLAKTRNVMMEEADQKVKSRNGGKGARGQAA